MRQICYLPLIALFAFGAALAADAPDSQHKQQIDEEQAIEMVAAALAAAPGLEFDTGFSVTGMRSTEPPVNTGWSDVEDGIRVFPWMGSATIGNPPIPIPVHLGYYVAVRQKNAANTLEKVMVTRLKVNGALDLDFGTNGWLQAENASSSIADVAMGRYGELYILHAGEKRVGCYRLEAGTTCHSPTSGGKLSYPLTAPRTAATPTRLLYDSRYGLYVAAKITNANRGTELAVTLMQPAGATGSSGGTPVTTFGTNGHVIGLPSWAAATGVTAAINAMALTPANATGGQRLYVGGQALLSGTDSDGFILGLDPQTGATSTGWNWAGVFYEDDNTGYKTDTVTALTVLRNGSGYSGKLVWAGWSQTDDAQTNPMIMGRRNSDSSIDASFCAGNANLSGSGVCLVDPPRSLLSIPVYMPSAIPVAIVERPNRDLAVAQRFQQNGLPLIGQPDKHVHTLVQQFGQDGNRLYTQLKVDYSASDPDTTTWWSRPFDMVASGVFGDRLALIGTRKWNGTDFDPTVTALKGATEEHVCLFSDGMESARPACW